MNKVFRCPYPLQSCRMCSRDVHECVETITDERNSALLALEALREDHRSLCESRQALVLEKFRQLDLLSRLYALAHRYSAELANWERLHGMTRGAPVYDLDTFREVRVYLTQTQATYKNRCALRTPDGDCLASPNTPCSVPTATSRIECGLYQPLKEGDQ